MHKENIDSIPNALDKRNDPEIEIYGMKGIPIEDMMKHQRDQNNRNVRAVQFQADYLSQLLGRRCETSAE